MGLVKTRRRLAEDMHRRGEASEGTLPKATRRARKRVRSPHRVMRKCCQCGRVASSNVADFRLRIEIGGGMVRGEAVWYNIGRKEN